MGFNKPTGGWKHVDKKTAIFYFWNMYWLWWIFIWGWHRFVYDEHVKFIAEYNPENNKFFGRTIFRSMQQYNEPEELNIDWWLGYIGEFNGDKTKINIIASMPEITDTEFKRLYKQYGGTGNF